MASSSLLRAAPVLRLLRIYNNPHRSFPTGTVAPRRHFWWFSAADTAKSDTDTTASEKIATTTTGLDEPRSYGSDDQGWTEKDDKIRRDIKAIKRLTKEILHSDRYMDGERLTTEDEKIIMKKLLPYHPHSEDKIGCGVDFIMVDRHPQYRRSRCLFVVRTDGGWEDFSYRKCVQAYKEHLRHNQSNSSLKS